MSAVSIGCSRRGNAAGDLRPAGMDLGQWSGEGDAVAGDLRARGVRPNKLRGDRDVS